MSYTTGEHDAYMRGVSDTYEKVMAAIAVAFDNNTYGEGIIIAHQQIHAAQSEDLKTLGVKL